MSWIGKPLINENSWDFGFCHISCWCWIWKLLFGIHHRHFNPTHLSPLLAMATSPCRYVVKHWIQSGTRMESVEDRGSVSVHGQFIQLEWFKMVKACIKQWSICDGRCRSTIWFNAGHCPSTARLKKVIAEGFWILAGDLPGFAICYLATEFRTSSDFSITQLFLVAPCQYWLFCPNSPNNINQQILTIKKTTLSCKRTLRTGACCEALCSRIGYGLSNLRSGLQIPGVTGKKRQEKIANRELEMASVRGRKDT